MLAGNVEKLLWKMETLLGKILDKNEKFPENYDTIQT